MAGGRLRPLALLARLAAAALLTLAACAPQGGYDPYLDRPPCTLAIGPAPGCDPGIGRRLGTDH